ncbi:hypothetical protein QTI66_29085 [Variovorax sp. J22R133]|uniref:hypothetical protein n=1 Tax=Variovorax brevis TaxID=3053503 RepID=UPI002577AAAB|nr:hypothetical protein [Variovorax sp. J22R133]MDM0116225.1 hypothetical protein [Variovorax sp. J22R133]
MKKEASWHRKVSHIGRIKVRHVVKKQSMTVVRVLNAYVDLCKKALHRDLDVPALKRIEKGYWPLRVATRRDGPQTNGQSRPKGRKLTWRPTLIPSLQNSTVGS